MKVYLKNGCWLKKAPRDSENSQAFTVDELVYPTLVDAKKFCRTIITDGESLVHLRNQLTFLLADLFGERHSSHFDIPFEKAVVFWAWIFLPADQGPQSEIISHDIVYIKRDLTDKEIKKVQSTIRQLNLNVFARRVSEQKSLCHGIVPARIAEEII